MTRYAYNGWGSLIGSIEGGSCPDGCETTDEAPPAAPYPDGQWPHYTADGWQLVEVVPKLAVNR